MLYFGHGPPRRLWEVEQREYEGRQQDGAEGREAVGSHGLVHEGPSDANYEVGRPVDLARHGHRRGDVPGDDGDNILYVNVRVMIRDKCEIEVYLREGK